MKYAVLITEGAFKGQYLGEGGFPACTIDWAARYDSKEKAEREAFGEGIDGMCRLVEVDHSVQDMRLGDLYWTHSPTWNAERRLPVLKYALGLWGTQGYQ